MTHPPTFSDHSPMEAKNPAHSGDAPPRSVTSQDKKAPKPPDESQVGFQGESHSYSDQTCQTLFPEHPRIGYGSFLSAFAALSSGEVSQLVVPIENSTTGSVLPVLDRLLEGDLHIVAEHLQEVRHSLLGIPGTSLDQIRAVWSHPEALSQSEYLLAQRNWEPIPVHDTAGAVRLVAEAGDPTVAALGPFQAAAPHGLEVLEADIVDRAHNTTRFVILKAGPQPIPPDANKTSAAFATLHQPGALALALTELGLRGANLTRIESRPAKLAWSYRFYIDLTHPPGPKGVDSIFVPAPSTLTDIRILGSYSAAH